MLEKGAGAAEEEEKISNEIQTSIRITHVLNACNNVKDDGKEEETGQLIN